VHVMHVLPSGYVQAKQQVVKWVQGHQRGIRWLQFMVGWGMVLMLCLHCLGFFSFGWEIFVCGAVNTLFWFVVDNPLWHVICNVQNA